MTLDEFRRHPAYDYYIITLVSDCLVCTQNGGLFEHKDNILTGRYFNRCCIRWIDIDKGYTPRPKQIIDCVEVEISPDNWIMSVDANNTDLAILSAYYHIDWKECHCLKGVKLEDVTPELEQKAFEEMK